MAAGGSSVMRFQKPRLLEAEETADSLEHWRNEFEVYLTRDDKSSQLGS